MSDTNNSNTNTNVLNRISPETRKMVNQLTNNINRFSLNNRNVKSPTIRKTVKTPVVNAKKNIKTPFWKKNVKSPTIRRNNQNVKSPTIRRNNQNVKSPTMRRPVNVNNNNNIVFEARRKNNSLPGIPVSRVTKSVARSPRTAYNMGVAKKSGVVTKKSGKVAAAKKSGKVVVAKKNSGGKGNTGKSNSGGNKPNLNSKNHVIRREDPDTNNNSSNSNNNNNTNHMQVNKSLYNNVALYTKGGSLSTARKKRKDLIKHIKKLIDDQIFLNSNNPGDIKNGLTYIYSRVFTEPQFINNTKLNKEILEKRIKKQLSILHKQRVNITDGDKQKVWGINPEEEMNIMFLIWCDMIHDETLDTKYDHFSVFINSNIIKSMFGDKRREVIHTRFIRTLLDILENPGNFNPIDGRPLPDTPKMFDALTSNNMITEIIKTKKNPQKPKNGKPAKKPTWRTGFEAYWKKYINVAIAEGYKTHSKKLRDNSQSIPMRHIKPGIFNNQEKDELLVSIDQENDHKDVSQSLLRSKNLNTRVKALQPTVSIANLIDPGSDMVSNSIYKNKDIFNDPTYDKIRSGLKWNLTPYDIKLGDMDVKTKLVDTGDDYTYNYFIRTKEYKSNVSKGKTQLSDDKIISKFMGDFYQILTAIRMTPNYKYYPISGDGMFCLIFGYVYKVVRKRLPKMIMIKGKESKETTSLTFLNLKHILNISNNSNGSRVRSGGTQSSKNWSNSNLNNTANSGKRN